MATDIFGIGGGTPPKKKRTPAKGKSSAVPKKSTAKCPKCSCKPCKCGPNVQPIPPATGGNSGKLSSFWNSKAGQSKGSSSSEPDPSRDVYESLKSGAQAVHQESDPRAESLRQRIGEIANDQTNLDRESLPVGERRRKQAEVDKAVQTLADDVAEYARHKKSRQYKDSLVVDIKKLTTTSPAAGPPTQNMNRGGRGRLFGKFGR